MSDIQATTLQGAAAPTESGLLSTEAQFQSFFDADNAAEPERRQTDPAAQANGANQPEARTEAQANKPTDPAASEPAEESEGAPQYQTLDELLAAHKIDPQSVRGLNLATKIDGVDGKATLADLLESYQLKGHVNNKSIEVSNQKQALEQERMQWRSSTQQALQQHQAMAQLAMQMINQDFSRVDWNALRVSNPAEYAALQTEFQQRQGQVQQFLGQVQQQQAQAQQEQQQAMQQNLAAEREKLHAAIPEWRDPAAFEADRQKISQYARNAGFQDAELNQIYDHRVMRVLHDAARYQELQAANPELLKKVRQAPRMAAPGSRQEVNPSEVSRKQVLDRLNRNPRDEDAQAAAFDFFAR